MAHIEQHQAHIWRIWGCNFKDQEAMVDNAATIPNSHYSIGKTENFLEHIGQFVQNNRDDPAVQVWLSFSAY